MIKVVYVYEYDIEVLKANLTITTEHRVVFSEKSDEILHLVEVNKNKNWIVNERLYKSTKLEELSIPKLLEEGIS